MTATTFRSLHLRLWKLFGNAVYYKLFQECILKQADEQCVTQHHPGETVVAGLATADDGVSGRGATGNSD